MQPKTHAVREHPQPGWTTLGAVQDEPSIVSALTQAGLSSRAARQKASLLAKSAASLQASSHAPDTPALAAFVPGRIEVFGKHTDYCGGRSLLCAVDRGLCIVAVRAPGRSVRISEITTNATASFTQEASLKPTVGGWPNYPMTVARRIARDFPDVACGIDAAFAGDLPLAAGMSSSTTLIIATWMMLSAAGNLAAHPLHQQHLAHIEDLVTYLGAIESGRAFGPFSPDGGVGTTGGSQDHAAVILSQAHRLAQVSYSPLRVERTVLLSPPWRLVIATSGVIAEKTGAVMERYNALSRRAARVLSIWNERTGRQDPTLADAIRSSPDATEQLQRFLDDDPDSAILTKRLRQFVLECETLVPDATRALEEDDIHLFGELADRSQRASEQWLDNQIPQTIALTRAARESGAVAASAFGAGFGGSAWALIQAPDSDAFLSGWMQRYRAQVDPDAAQRASAWITDAGPGALWIGP